MERRHLLGADVAVDVTGTRIASLASRAVDPDHCPECAVFAEAVHRSATLGPLLELVRSQGADPLRPDDLWGAVDGNVLNGCWSLVGELVTKPPEESEAVTFAPGLTAWIGPPVALAEPPFEGKPVLTIEFWWESSEVGEIGAALGLPMDPPAPT
jgi:hypothetical protein